MNEKKIIEFLNGKWKKKTCPICNKNNWTIGDKVFGLTEQEITKQEDKIIMKAKSAIFPVIPVVCAECGNTILINAILAGCITQDNTKEKVDE